MVFTPGPGLCVKVLCGAVVLVGCCASVDESGRSHLRLSQGFYLKLIQCLVLELLWMSHCGDGCADHDVTLQMLYFYCDTEAPIYMKTCDGQ